MKKLIEHKCYQSTNTLLLSFLTIMINNFERKIYFDTFCKCAQLEVSVSFDIMTGMPTCHLYLWIPIQTFTEIKIENLNHKMFKKRRWSKYRDTR